MTIEPFNARTLGPLFPKAARVEWPLYKETVTFSNLAAALSQAQKWAVEDRALVLVWDFAAAMYVGRYDGRSLTAGQCDKCDGWSDDLKHINADNPFTVADVCIGCYYG